MANEVFHADPMICQRVATVYAGAAPGANTNILTASITPSQTASAYRVTVALATASVFNVFCDSGTDYTFGLNGSTALNAGDLYTFVFGVTHNTDGSLGTGTAVAYNFRVETDGVIQLLLVDEILGAVI